MIWLPPEIIIAHRAYNLDGQHINRPKPIYNYAAAGVAEPSPQSLAFKQASKRHIPEIMERPACGFPRFFSGRPH
jgi:hypothetical protein